MSKTVFSHAKILGLCTVVPKHGVRLQDELQYFEGSLKKAQRMTKMIGIDCRRIADDGVTSSDMCQQAAEHLFNDLNIDRNSIDALVFVSQTPDHKIPTTASILQNKLGLSQNIASFDVNQGCTAYVYALWLASSLVESGACKRILLCVGDAGARWAEPDNRVMTPIFGDCGTATIIDYCEAERPSYYVLGTDGSGAEYLIIPAGAARMSICSMEYMQKALHVIHDGVGNPWMLGKSFMDGSAIYEFTMRVIPEHIQELMAYAGKSQEELDYLVLHQANKQIVFNIANKVGFSLEKTPTATVTKYGNQAGASVASTLCDQLKEEINTKKITTLISSFGVGLSWASCIVDLEGTYCAGVHEYEVPENHPTTAENYAYWEEKLKNHYKENAENEEK